MTTRPVEYTDLVTVHVEQTLHTVVSDAWEVIVSCPELWIGDTVRMETDGTYVVDGCLDGGHARGQIEEVALLERVVLTWQLDGWDDSALVEVTLVEAGAVHTLMSVHVEDVPDHVGRRDVAVHWEAALARVAAAADHPRAA